LSIPGKGIGTRNDLQFEGGREVHQGITNVFEDRLSPRVSMRGLRVLRNGA